MRRLVPQPEEIENAGGEIHQQKGGQKSANLDAERGGADAEGHRPEHEQRRVLRAVRFKLLAHIGKVAPFLRRHGDPLDAAAGRKKRHGDGDQPKADPDGPPIFFAKQLAPRRATGKRAATRQTGRFPP